MKIIYLVGSMLFILGVQSITAQVTLTPADRSQDARNERDLQRRMQDMRALDSYSRRRSERDRREFEAFNPPELDKKTKERIRQMRIFDSRDIARYNTFLSEAKTGIFKLFPNYDCRSERVIRVDGDCSKFVPETSDFSFRSLTYTNSLYHDIGYGSSGLVSDAFFSQGVLVNLGDVSIENVGQTTAGLQFLYGINPESTVNRAKQSSKAYEKGVKAGDFRYASSVEPAENRTYALRMIAYQVANSLPAISDHSTMNEYKFKSLEMDKREDIIIAFRVVRKDQFGGLTIVWKELDRKDAPKIRFGKSEALSDFKE